MIIKNTGTKEKKKLDSLIGKSMRVEELEIRIA